ncbi:hypothetical protein CHU98_g130 [Xylaria longipes]|nr:hypothetical protein CHU98_g130 [Xylaria longipes]
MQSDVIGWSEYCKETIDEVKASRAMHQPLGVLYGMYKTYRQCAKLLHIRPQGGEAPEVLAEPALPGRLGQVSKKRHEVTAVEKTQRAPRPSI